MTSSQDVSLHSHVDQFLGNIRIYIPAKVELPINEALRDDDD